jgi:hypothetical protein
MTSQPTLLPTPSTVMAVPAFMPLTTGYALPGPVQHRAVVSTIGFTGTAVMKSVAVALGSTNIGDGGIGMAWAVCVPASAVCRTETVSTTMVAAKFVPPAVHGSVHPTAEQTIASEQQVIFHGLRLIRPAVSLQTQLAFAIIPIGLRHGLTHCRSPSGELNLCRKPVRRQYSRWRFHETSPSANSLAGNDKPHHDIGNESRQTPGDQQYRKAETEPERTDAEELGEAAAHTGQDPVLSRAPQGLSLNCHEGLQVL